MNKSTSPPPSQEKTKSWTILAAQRQVLDLNQLIQNWNYQSVTLTAKAGPLSTTIMLQQWPLCNKKKP